MLTICMKYKQTYSLILLCDGLRLDEGMLMLVLVIVNVLDLAHDGMDGL